MNRLVSIFALLTLVSVAQAHEVQGSHGGVVADAGAYHVELVAKGQAVEVYVMDGANKAMSAEGLKGTAILIVDGKTQRIALTPGTGNRLIGAAVGKLPAKPKGAVQIQIKVGTMVTGKF